MQEMTHQMILNDKWKHMWSSFSKVVSLGVKLQDIMEHLAKTIIEILEDALDILVDKLSALADTLRPILGKLAEAFPIEKRPYEKSSLKSYTHSVYKYVDNFSVNRINTKGYCHSKRRPVCRSYC